MLFYLENSILYPPSYHISLYHHRKEKVLKSDKGYAWTSTWSQCPKQNKPMESSETHTEKIWTDSVLASLLGAGYNNNSKTLGYPAGLLIEDSYQSSCC